MRVHGAVGLVVEYRTRNPESSTHTWSTASNLKQLMQKIWALVRILWAAGEGWLGWRYVFLLHHRSSYLLAWAMDGHIMHCGTIGLCQSATVPLLRLYVSTAGHWWRVWLVSATLWVMWPLVTFCWLSETSKLKKHLPDTYIVVHTGRYVSRATFWFVDTDIHRVQEKKVPLIFLL